MKGAVSALRLVMVCGITRHLSADHLLDMPRKTIGYPPGDAKIFQRPDVFNFSTLLVNEETNTLYVAAKDYILALDLSDISKEITREPWFASEDKQRECVRRGKSKSECQNYILLLHKMNATTLYVCGTNAFHPACRNVVIGNADLKLHGKAVESRGKCPFEPTMRSASLMADGALYSATSNNFLGTEPIILRSLKNPLRTEFTASWLYEPTFVHMALIRENSASPDSEKIYIFFTETAVEFEFYDKLLVSRVAQLCKGDLGGKRVLKKRWTSFLKTTLACAAPELDSHFSVMRDVFVLRAAPRQETIFYGVFTQQWGSSDVSAVCAFRMEDVRDAFSNGNFKGPLAVENSHVKWVVHQGDAPSPRPGSCIGADTRRQGYKSSLDLPDKALQFARDHPLMDDTVSPVGHRPVLLKRGTKYTQIVVDRTTGVDNATYDVLFLGTEKGYLHKALNCHGETFLVQEIQLFPSQEPVRTLKLAARKGLLYAGSPSQLVQLPVASCGQYKSCIDCVLARDPYCAWSPSLQSCIPVARQPRDLIQSVGNGDASRCSEADKRVTKYPAAIGSSLRLSCTPMSNLASSVWTLNGSLLKVEGAKHLFLPEGLVVFNVTPADAGFYECQSVEKAGGKEFRLSAAAYLLYPQRERDSNATHAGSARPKSESSAPPGNEDPTRQRQQPRRIQGLLLTLWGSVSTCLFLALLAWNVSKGYLPMPRRTRATGSEVTRPELSLAQLDSTPKSSATQTVASTASESAPLVSCPGEGAGGKVQRDPCLTKEPWVSGPPDCAVRDETQRSSEAGTCL